MASCGAIQNFLFHSFVNAWFVELQHYYNELHAAQLSNELQESDLKDLIDRVLDHYNHYYEQKKQVIYEDVLHVLNPTWFTPLELSCFLVADFKPTDGLLLINNSVDHLTDEQRNKIWVLTESTKQTEKCSNIWVQKVQESMGGSGFLAAPTTYDEDGVVVENNDDLVMQKFIGVLVTVVINTDILRKKTVAEVIGILDLKQSVQFLAATIYSQLMLRCLGLELSLKLNIV